MVITLLLAACVELGDTGSVRTGAVDADGDGYPADIDCDDGDASIAPTAPELCNGVDDDCDGEVDEQALDAPTWYADGDGDGWGDAPTVACDAPEGHVAQDGDCDDDDGDRHPDATETCDGLDDDCDGRIDEELVGATTWYLDADGDGYGSELHADSDCDGVVPDGWVTGDAFDCDDTRADVSPAGVETCDGVDEDCDGETDEEATDASTWYPDEDDDGYGDDAGETIGCPMDGWIATGGDCDDAEDEVHPEADEVCNELDDDCDGDVDAMDDNALGVHDLYRDFDGDGWGTGSARTMCPQSGFVSENGDCHDGDATMNPGATEDCYDEVDNDCDGLTDADDPDLGATTYYPDSDRDGFGATGAGENHCDAQPLMATVAGDCDDGDAQVNPGEAEVCGDGLDNDCSGDDNGLCLGGSVSDAHATYVGAARSNYLGRGLAGADRDGDGVQEAVVGAYGSTSSRGTVSVFDSTQSGSWAASTASEQWTGTNYNDYLGWAVAGGDVDGDGLDELVLTAYAADIDGVSSSGAVYLLDDDAGSGTVSTAATTTWSGLYGWSIGTAVAVGGDLDDDGATDILIGASSADWTGSNSGAVFVVPADDTGSHSVYTAAVVYGTATSDYLGNSVARAGDVDGDGIDDLLAGAYGNDDAGSSSGTSYVVLGPVTGARSADDADVLLWGESSSDDSGYAVAGVDDHDGDGYDDVLIGAYDAGSGGRAYLVLGPPSDLDLDDADAILYGDSNTDYAMSVENVGDIDGDGWTDVGVGAQDADDGASNSGTVFVYTQRLEGAVTTGEAAARTGAAASDYLFLHSALGDVDGDGYDDLLLGAYAADPGGTSSGAAYVVLGGLGI